MKPSYKIREPGFPDSKDLFASLGGVFKILLSGGSIPSANAGKESVTRLMNNICTGKRNEWFGIIKEITKIPKTSTMLVESRNVIAFEMF